MKSVYLVFTTLSAVITATSLISRRSYGWCSGRCGRYNPINWSSGFHLCVELSSHKSF